MVKSEIICTDHLIDLSLSIRFFLKKSKQGMIFWKTILNIAFPYK